MPYGLVPAPSFFTEALRDEFSCRCRKHRRRGGLRASGGGGGRRRLAPRWRAGSCYAIAYFSYSIPNSNPLLCHVCYAIRFSISPVSFYRRVERRICYAESISDAAASEGAPEGGDTAALRLAGVQVSTAT